jgi:hypothetical protein
MQVIVLSLLLRICQLLHASPHGAYCWCPTSGIHALAMRLRHSGVLPISLLLHIHVPAAFGRPAHQTQKPLGMPAARGLRTRQRQSICPRRRRKVYRAGSETSFFAGSDGGSPMMMDSGN